MLGFITSLGIGVEYTRAEGDTVFYRDEHDAEVPVVDYAGGYGALILGHNHPRLVAAARQVLDERAPIFAQASLHPHASQVARRLNDIVRREFGAQEPYFAIFANSGAEGIEVALKHAELDRGLRMRQLLERIDAGVAAARAEVSDGALVPAETLARLGLTGGAADPAADVERLAAHVARWNAKQAARPPIFLAFEGSFHGKLVGSVQLTYNEAFRAPFTAMAAGARFVPFDDPDALAKVLAEEHAVLLDLVVEAGAVRVVERAAPIVAALVCEVIQGEGGIRVLRPDSARQIARVCAEHEVPVIVDEIQTGVGRTGAFFASSLAGLPADYLVLAKSLGGGIAKTSVTLIRGGRYRAEFELVHSSTFAKDTLSSAVALAVIDTLEERDGLLYQQARERGERLRQVFDALRADFPDVVKDVRGAGLMLGLEFHDQSGSTAATIAEAARANIFGYAIAGFLLRRHRIRTFPTASAVNTLRFEPSVLLTDEQIAQLDTALRDLAGILRDQDEQRLRG